MENKKLNCLVTGGAGFIGSHLVERLLDLGCKVTVIDNCSSGRLENLRHLSDRKDMKLVLSDITQTDYIFNLFADVDWVFHLAALADIVPSIQNPGAYHRANVDGTVVVLEAARTANVKRIVYSASSSCYGVPGIFPTPETAPVSPQYPYALTKYLGEMYVMHWSKVFNLPAVSLRLFNVYGPRSRTSGTYGAVFGVFLAQKLAGKPFTVVGDGNQTRDFTYVSDVVDALLAAAQSDVVGEIFNVGSGNTVSVNQLVDLLGGPVTHIPKRPGEPDCTFADISKINKALNWQAKITFEDGVETMLNQIDYWRDAPVWSPETITEATREWFEFLGPAKLGVRD